MRTVKAHGAEIPALGFGTFELAPDDAHRMVAHALKTGYRHIDTAQIYRNEDAVGTALAESDVDRGDVFLTTKVWVDRFGDGDLQRSVEESLKRLRTDHVDLLLLHWPNPDVPLSETLKALNEVRDEGLTRHIGISNFTVELIEEAVSLSAAPLATNQVEYHPFIDQRPVSDALARHHMALSAYCPLARGGVFRNPTLDRIGRRHDKSPGQVALRWLLQQDNVVALPRSGNEAHADDNLAVLDFELSEAEMHEIFELHSPDGRLISPEGLAPAWDTAA
ncbi:putative 2,5-diketo-D-gluconate reductase B (DkgB-like) protein [Salinisphaera sp. PC39]|uniref:aldo/keto reductase n=1 Tax=Salinisphaera sp. PC39 TaxID=1304156 RepID=UPI00333F6E0E